MIGAGPIEIHAGLLTSAELRTGEVAAARTTAACRISCCSIVRMALPRRCESTGLSLSRPRSSMIRTLLEVGPGINGSLCEGRNVGVIFRGGRGHATRILGGASLGIQF